MITGTKVKHSVTGETGVVSDNPPSYIPDSVTVVYKGVGLKRNQPIASLQVIAVPAPPKPKATMLEWVDPTTGKPHVCPEHYLLGLQQHVAIGKVNARLASDILQLMGEENTESNKRHIRQAALYLKQNGTPVISYRSGDGGYFRAGTQEEINEYVSQQHKLANSMKTEADALAKAFAASAN